MSFKSIFIVVIFSVWNADDKALCMDSAKLDLGFLNNNCFDGYLANLHNASTSYQDSYEKCIDEFNNEQQQVHEYEENERTEIVLLGEEICSNIHRCNKIEDPFEFFHCSKDKNTDNVDKMNEIKTKSSMALINISMDHSEAEKQLNICTAEAQRVYEADVKHCVDQLNICLINNPNAQIATETA